MVLGAGDGVAVCANAVALDMRTTTSDEPDNSRLRRQRMDMKYFMGKFPDADLQTRRKGVHATAGGPKLEPACPCVKAPDIHGPKPRCQEIGGPRDRNAARGGSTKARTRSIGRSIDTLAICSGSAGGVEASPLAIAVPAMQIGQR